ncbi:Outer membrane efflux protein [Candidatus Magnetobacterium bavaricum]|uniref:Outer membrane efflux protein n=1 Tax=Candidatus Magnetobacterium bavaricum TaxID=29290 RepID=A0A0F3GZK3_9BACT|nr:Outer membrane efflux protein [Candidatus Magnetobacterium bavaricum]
MSIASHHYRFRGLFRLTCLLVILMPLPLPGADMSHSYSLEELYRHAMQTSETIKISEEEIYIARQQKTKAIAAIIPRVSAFSLYTQYNRDKTVPGGMVMQPSSSISGGLRLDEGLSLGGKELKAIDMAEKSIEKNRYDYDSVTEGYLYGIAGAFYDCLKAKKAIEIAQASIERLTLYRDAAKTRLLAGEITKTSLLRAEAELSTATAEALQAQNDLKIKKATLKQLAGLKDDFDVRDDLPTTHDLANCPTDNIECLVQTAINRRTELKSYATQREIAQKTIESASSSYWPTLSIEAVLMKKDDNPGWLFNNSEIAYATVKLSLPVYEGGIRQANINEARAKQRQSELAIEGLKKTISLDVESAYLTYRTQQGVISSLKDTLVYATDNYSSVNRQFDAGLATSLDVMDANNLLATSQRKLSEAIYGYEMAWLKLKHSMGIPLSSITERSMLNQVAPVANYSGWRLLLDF